MDAPNPPSAKVVALPTAAKKSSEKKWGVTAMKPGFVILPSLLLKAQSRLGLNCTQLATLLQLSEFWWHEGKYPWPKKETLAQRLGLSTKQVQRTIADLEKGGFLIREVRMGQNGQKSNAYNMAGLVKKLNAIAPEFIEAAEQKQRLERKGSKLAKLAKG